MIKYVQPVTAAESSGLTAQVYPQIKRDFGALVEPFTLHSPAPQLLAGVWIATRETALVASVRRDLKEAVAATVSRINQCPYCVDAHTMMLHATAAHDAAAAISRKRDDQIQDPTLRAIITWAAATRSPGDPILLAPPFSEQEGPEIAGTAVVFHYINRMVDVFLNETPLPSNRGWLKPTFKRMAGWYFSRAARRPKPAGASLVLLPAAEPGADLVWAAASPTVVDAFARWTAVVEEAGEEALPASVRALVRERVEAWNGESLGISRHWVEEAIVDLDGADQPAARLALLTAFASYQVDEGVVEAFRTQQPGDDKLIGATAWASFIAARRVGTWLQVPAATS
ncbi:MAG: carboxymuconolactone decarboxylase family protein [Chloroflexota bacterium]|nr:carboxymuconolactone decarboxylase family protein [Chloroflexota bacterium]